MKIVPASVHIPAGVPSFDPPMNLSQDDVDFDNDNGGGDEAATKVSYSKGSASSVSSSVAKKAKRQKDMRLYVHQSLSADELEIANKHLLKLVVDAGLPFSLPFSFVERPTF